MSRLATRMLRPLMLDAVRALLFAAQPSILSCRRRPSQGSPTASGQVQLDGPRAFELIGMDFAVDDTWRPWLLEANMSPNMCEDCRGEHASTLRAWAQEATASLLSIVVAHHNGQLPIPSVAELEALSAGQAPSARLFQAPHCTTFGSAGSAGTAGCSGRASCHGARALGVPGCLARGLDLGAPCSPWLLSLREPASEEEASSATARDRVPPPREPSRGFPNVPTARTGGRSVSTGPARGSRHAAGVDRASRPGLAAQATAGYDHRPLPKLATHIPDAGV